MLRSLDRLLAVEKSRPAPEGSKEGEVPKSPLIDIKGGAMTRALA
jgi:hypothetical protein